MSETPRDRVLVDLWRTGDQQAARELVDCYIDRLLALARRRISQRLASRIDPEDVVQSVFRTFFSHARKGDFHIADQDDLCKLLMRITVHKTLRQVAFHKAAKRDMTLEKETSDAKDRFADMMNAGPTSEQAVAFLDELEHFLSRLRPQERQMLEMRIQGYSNEEIAAELHTYDRKIRRVFERIRELAEKEGLAS
jgi:RNA polymerase sigma factor (sigma-70 family)